MIATFMYSYMFKNKEYCYYNDYMHIFGYFYFDLSLFVTLFVIQDFFLYLYFKF